VKTKEIGKEGSKGSNRARPIQELGGGRDVSREGDTGSRGGRYSRRSRKGGRRGKKVVMSG